MSQEEQMTLDQRRIHRNQINQNLLQKYHSTQELFNTRGISQRGNLILHQVVSKNNLNINNLPIVQQLKRIAIELLMNDLEILMWAILLKKLDWKLDNLEYFFLFTAFAAKQNLNQDSEYIEAYIKSKYKDFRIPYNQWKRENSQSLNVSAQHVNKKFNQFIRSQIYTQVTTFNYNYYVDEVSGQEINQKKGASDMNQDNFQIQPINSNQDLTMKPIFSETGITKLPSIRISDSFGIRNGFSYDDLSAVLKLEPMSPQKLQGYNQDSLDPITPKNGENLFFSN